MLLKILICIAFVPGHRVVLAREFHNNRTGGAMTFTANGLPIIKEVPGQDNIIVALVGNGNGIGLGAAAGPLVKGLVLGRDSIDASTQRFLKFCSWPQQ